MHLYLTPLVFLVAGIAQASTISVRAPRGCEGAVAIESKMFGAVNYTMYACGSPFVTTDLAAQPVSKARSALENRQYNACTTSPPTCQSTTLCNNDYCSGYQSAAPLLSDCNVITNELEGSANTGTVFVAAQHYVSLAYGTCEYRWGNQGTTTLEYALFNWGELGSVIYNNCITVYHYGRGTCIPYNNLWFAETVVPGSPL